MSELFLQHMLTLTSKEPLYGDIIYKRISCNKAFIQSGFHFLSLIFVFANVSLLILIPVDVYTRYCYKVENKGYSVVIFKRTREGHGCIILSILGSGLDSRLHSTSFTCFIISNLLHFLNYYNWH